jgi:predicted transcriptional regulator
LDILDLNSKNFLFLIFEVNIFLSILNLIPAFPMDGGRAFRAILSLFMSRVKATRIASVVGIVFAVAFILLGIFFNPFLILIGFLIIFSASNESSVVNISALLEGHTAGDLVMQKFDVLDENFTIAEVSKEILDGQSTNFGIVSVKKEVIGTISKDILIRSLKSYDPNTPLSKIMNPITDVIPSKTLLKDIFADKIFENNNLVPVIEDHEILGMINFENILEFIAFKKSTLTWENNINQDRIT